MAVDLAQGPSRSASSELPKWAAQSRGVASNAGVVQARVGTQLEQPAGERNVAAFDGGVQRALPLLFDGDVRAAERVHVEAGADEQLDRVEALLARGPDHERRALQASGRDDVGGSGLHRGGVARERGRDECFDGVERGRGRAEPFEPGGELAMTVAERGCDRRRAVGARTRTTSTPWRASSATRSPGRA